MTEKWALDVLNLTVNYERTAALWDVSFQIPKGQLTAIVGPNGAGKSTLMKAAIGLIKPLSGAISLLGKPIKKIRKQIAYVPQRESVDWDFPITVLDLVLMGCYGRIGLFRFPTKYDRQLAMECLEELGIDHLAQRQISQLSGGQQQRAFIARSLFQRADLYFLDEPFAGIDTTSSKVILDLLIRLKSAGKSVFVVHHDLDSVAAHYDYAVLLNVHLVAAGKVCDIFTEKMLSLTFGKDHVLLERAVQLDQEKRMGNLV